MFQPFLRFYVLVSFIIDVAYQVGGAEPPDVSVSTLLEILRNCCHALAWSYPYIVLFQPFLRFYRS
ncbi:MAG: hypothetical protein ACO2PM_25370 [Pyrobaculum sp.]